MLKIIVNADRKIGRINRNIYGHFSEHLGRCIYGGFWVGNDSPIPNIQGIRKDVVDALRELCVPVLRWPGGCFADDYHWMNGIGPYKERVKTINAYWGGLTESNHFGTHEFLTLCELIGAQPYICGNVGSGTVQEMRDWVEYITSDTISHITERRRENGREKPWKLPYFGIGNENWGMGGQMRPEYYADIYNRYACYVRNYGENRIYKIACGPHCDDYNWTDVLMRKAGRNMDGMSLHYYTIPGTWKAKGSSTEFGEAEWYDAIKKTLMMEELIEKHGTIMDRYDPEKRIGLIIDEWGAWYDVEPNTDPAFLYQQNTLRDAMIAGINLNIFNRHCDRVRMANIAQTINVLQSVILTDGDRMLLTPTYHVYNMFKVHQDAELLDTICENDEYQYDGKSMQRLSVSVSMDGNGIIHMTLCNVHPWKSLDICCELRGETINTPVKATVLTADRMNAHNTFEAPFMVRPAAYDGVFIQKGKVSITMPPMSIISLSINQKEG